MHSYRFQYLPALLLAAVAAHASADDELLVQILTCNLQGEKLSHSNASEILNARAKPDGNGGSQLTSPIRYGSLCIENAKFSGAFGVFMATGSLCDGNAKRLIDFVKEKQNRLIPKEFSSDAGPISAFEAPNYGLVLFRGEPDMRGRPDPTSKHLSYICTYQGSGPQ